MKISSVTAFWMQLPTRSDSKASAATISHHTRWRQLSKQTSQPESVVVCVETDNGLVGWGEAAAGGNARVIRYLVDGELGPILLGADAQKIAPLWERMYATVGISAEGVAAIAAIDIALWDLLGKHVGVSVARLLGSRIRDRVPLHLSDIRADSSSISDDIVAGGFSTVCLQQVADTPHVLKQIERLQAEGISLAVNMDGTCDFAAARRIGQSLQLSGVRWIENPLPPELASDAPRLAAILDVPIVGGCTLTTRWQFNQALVASAFDIVQPDVGQSGGLSECRRIVTLADTYGRPYIASNTPNMGILTAATLQLAASAPNLMSCAWSLDARSAEYSLLRQPVPVEDGYVIVSDAPGLGINVDKAALENWAVK
jgi:L-alanine-DL-glutamate epimerase-like enolase superfamily enzyme